ncbi:Radical SAM domain protein [Desulfofarcimen acetoxidans DSM 771]|uniref:Radical SAM domain protein n=2 Tax=Desulfofarcimen acetoxidans TaxID=58138 RepID=C8VVJ7_DESAS|nr:Radical SAM domain protein [Desulfofarcimen acetoxidans DSM 771]
MTMDEREMQLDITKQYNMPNNLSRKYLPDGILIISVDTANWVLLHNHEQEKIFDLLIAYSIEDVLNQLESSDLSLDDLLYVLTELEAKQFESDKQKEQGLKSLNLYMTNKCNLCCRHCYMFAGTPLENELQSNEILVLLKEFQRYGGCNLILSGGEITNREDLREIVSAANELHLKTTLLTNGTDWPDDLVEYISDKVAEVQVSIDGYDEESNSKIRGIGQFQRALDTVKRLFDKGVRVTVAVTPMYPIDKVKYINFGKLLMDTFCSENFNIKFSYELMGGRDYSSTHIDNEAYRKTVEDIVEFIYPGNKLEKFALNHKNKMLFSNCGYGALTVAADGGVFFCNRVSDLKCYGNIRDMTFEKIAQLADKICVLSDVDNLMPCKDCNLKYICGGGCRIAYVPSILQADPYSELVFQREGCSESDRIKLYNKMIAANHLFYW